MEASTIAKLLPEVYRETRHPGSVLDALLGVMEAFTTPAELTLSSLDSWFDPRRARDDFLRMLATWTSLGPYVNDDDLKRGEGRRRSAVDAGNLRELVAAGAALSRIRGTREALAAMLELATGIRGFEIDENPMGEDGKPQPYCFVVRAPASARALNDLVQRIVEREKPAFVTATIDYLDRT